MSSAANAPPLVDDKKVISEETSKRICDHMNEDHAVSIYAMAKRQGPKPEPGWKMTATTIKTVTMAGATIHVTMCRGDACRQVQVVYPFIPPLTEPHQIRSRMVAIHHQVCNPKNCYDHTLFPATVVFFLTTLYYALGWNGPDSDPTLAKAMRDCCFLMSTAHTGMALYGTYLSYSVLKLKRRGILHWCVAIFLSGWLGLKELMQLIDVDEKSREAKEETSKLTASSEEKKSS